MRNPAGKECNLFYGDYFRGRTKEECRLLKSNNLDWNPRLCNNCPMPDILAANACENMRFQPRIDKGLLRKSQVKVNIHCVKCECKVSKPRIGCGQCHPLPDIFIVAPENPE